MAYFSEADSLKSFTVLGTDFRAWSSQWRVILVFPSEVSGKLDSSEHQNRCFFFFFSPVWNSGREVSFLLYYYYFLVLEFSFQHSQVPLPSDIIRYISVEFGFYTSRFPWPGSVMTLICHLFGVCHFFIWLMKRYYPLCCWLVKFIQRTCAK